MKSLSEITKTEKLQQGNQCLPGKKLSFKLLHSITVRGVHCCHNISKETSQHVWVSDDRNNLILINTKGVTLQYVMDLCSRFHGGIHTVNSEGELIYIDLNYDIKTLSQDMKTTKFIKKTNSTWKPRCVYWSRVTMELLVGMYQEIKRTGMVIRYNQSGQITETIKHDNQQCEFYKEPNYITENNNGDVVVSDFSAVVVTMHRGRYRFSYTGHPSGSKLRPWGICTDALSHILVCNGVTKSIQMINKDGQFLLDLPRKTVGIFSPHSLSYDGNTNRLWAGSKDNNIVCTYDYIVQDRSECK